MNERKWKKWRLSKARFPTFIVHGMNGAGSGTLVIGRQKAKEHLSGVLGSARVDAMIATDTRTEWVFMEVVV